MQYQNGGNMGSGALDQMTFNTNSLPQTNVGPSIQNNIQNLNLNINLSKNGYGSS